MNPLATEGMTMYAISGDLVLRLVNYLKRQPFEDVNELIGGLYMAQPIDVLPPVPVKESKPQ